MSPGSVPISAPPDALLRLSWCGYAAHDDCLTNAVGLLEVADLRNATYLFGNPFGDEKHKNMVWCVLEATSRPCLAGQENF